jgi:uncharacterized protein with PIN domain
MAFFEQIGKKISDAGQGAAQQAKIFSEVAKLNSSISDKEKKINQLYISIGQAYYQQHKDEEGAFAQDKMQEITALTAEIAKCRDEICQVKGISKCPQCGGEVPRGSAFCSSCGAKVPQASEQGDAAAQEEHTCPNCHAHVSQGDQFCIQCGTKIETPKAPEA